MNILLATDSYKGSLSSLEAADKIKEGILRVLEDATIQTIAVADGGEGTVHAVLSSLGGFLKQVMVTGPLGNKIEAFYGILENDIAVIEMAAASGLPLVPEKERDVMRATTYGTGELIKEALNHSCKKIYLGVGGSATNDGGIGMAQALGISFKDENGNEIGLGGKELSKIKSISTEQCDSRLKHTQIIVMSDVTNPLCGEKGASAVYGPQKGATAEQIKMLDEGLYHLASIIEETLQIKITELSGAGAAGGLGGGLVAFTGAKICSGIEAILEMAEFETKIREADLVITGEGRIDSQSAYGKVISGIAQKAQKYKVPVVAIAGALSTDASLLYGAGVDALEAIVCRPMQLSEAMGDRAGGMLADAAERFMRTLQIGYNMAAEKSIKKEENID